MNARNVILVTGCNDYVGSAITRHFSPLADVISMDLYLRRNKPDNVDYRSVHFSRRTPLEDVLCNVRSEFGYRLKSVIHLRSKNGNEEIVSAIRDIFEVAQFILIDLGNRSPVTIPNVPTVNLHLPGVYDDHCHLLPLGKHISSVFEERLGSHFYSENKTFSYLHVDDLLNLLDALIREQKRLPPFLDVTVKGEDDVSEKELVGELGRLLHEGHWPLVKLPRFRVPPSHRTNGNDSSPLQRFDWHAGRKLLLTLPKMIELLKSDPLKWYEENQERNIYHAEKII